MSYADFRFETGEDGIAVVTWDMPDRSMNVFTMEVMDELEAIVERVAGDPDIRGAVIASGKDAFSGGADITMIHRLFHAYRAKAAGDPDGARRELLAESSRMSRLFRRLETCGKPFVAAIHGVSMGGATELALAAHARVLSDDRATRIGLPEVKIGIFPGAGGTQRVMRMADPQAGLQMLLKGETLDPGRALAMGLADRVVPRAGLLEAARAMIAAGLDPVKPWDAKGYRPKGAANPFSPAGFQVWPAANALYRKETFDNYPAARALLQSVFEGLQLPMDLALRVESRYFAHVLQTKEAEAMIRSLFVSLQALNKGARRPASVPKSEPRRVGIIGAGFMGAGIAHATAQAGIEVVLLDRDRATAEKGKAHSADLLDKAVRRGRATASEKDATLARIAASADYADLAGCDLVVEAVFEDRAVKAEVMRQAAPHLGAGTVFASNTSTLPITSLAAGAGRPADFIGIHFFSPVDRMMLVEVILGRETGARALATAMDYVRAIRKTPIVVNDSRGFYANRCVMAYLLEGHLMLTEGVPAAMIENAGRMAGMPVGPLALNDEVALDLAWKILQAAKADLGPAAIDPAQERLLEELVVRRERLGRKNGRGFYDYDGREKRLWPGLAEIVAPRSGDAFPIGELKRRLLATQALEAARTFEEGVVTDPREADVGSILGFGFAPFTGGTLSYIDGIGAAAFVDMCDALADRFGERFRPNPLLRGMAASGETFYGRFAPAV
ncbi:3-hydroxyacyl-CoA dehydrogenase NAD-binding domain-containing protein [Propylenella binzhouense]|uniref:enoyl-CoA hydratase n=1 Tax=Propylenella binzhouense TaxID=2555902 RepID=A0A964T6U9_9HYPH|nr:3-hydroxyacyl-CoA dehydrogenase NAD-binding domain-containing protein [Propylenella binzhouense]MYZ49616.1 3-hydroxyacyl-CoA dehydrogenase [Propylenella binzhouense]